MAEETIPIELPSEDAVKTWKQNYRLFKGLFVEGFVEIATSFQYQGKDYEFRTLVQPDADIILYVPELKALKEDKRYRSIYFRKHKEHQKKLRNTLQLFQPNGKVVGYVIDAVLILGNAYSAFSAYQQGDLEGGLIGSAIAGVSVVYRKYFKSATIKAILKFAFKLVKLFLKIKGK